MSQNLEPECESQHIGACANCRAMAMCDVGYPLWNAAMRMVLKSYTKGYEDYILNLRRRMMWVVAFCDDPDNTEREKDFRRAMLLTEALEFYMMREPGNCPPGMLLETFTILKRLVLEQVMLKDRTTF